MTKMSDGTSRDCLVVLRTDLVDFSLSFWLDISLDGRRADSREARSGAGVNGDTECSDTLARLLSGVCEGLCCCCCCWDGVGSSDAVTGPRLVSLLTWATESASAASA